jgi:hypothetical protein
MNYSEAQTFLSGALAVESARTGRMKRPVCLAVCPYKTQSCIHIAAPTARGSTSAYCASILPPPDLRSALLIALLCV